MNARRRALLQTARIVFGASAVACGATSSSSPAPEPLPTAATPTATTTHVARHHPEDGCSLDHKPDGGLTDEAATCCMASTTAAFARDAGAADFQPCCDELSKTALLTWYVYDKKWSQGACDVCATLIKDRAACTPWGPPMPPPMA